MRGTPNLVRRKLTAARAVASLLLVLIVIGANRSEADEKKHLGTLLGYGYEDQSGDSPYHPLNWCGDLLWVQSERHVSLIDPATRELRSNLDDIGSSGFVACHGDGGQSLVWTTTAGGMAWRTIDDKAIGVVLGVAYDPFRGLPLMGFLPGLTMVVAPKWNVHVINAPTGTRLVTLPIAGLSKILADVDRTCVPAADPSELVDLKLISPRLLALRVIRDVLATGPFAMSGETCRSKGDAVTLVEIDTRQDRVRVGRHWNLDELLPDPSLDTVEDLAELPGGNLRLSINTTTGTQECKMKLASGKPEMACSERPYQPQQSAVMIGAIETFARGQWHSIDTSDSGEWTAWSEEVATGDLWGSGKVALYLARTHDILRAAPESAKLTELPWYVRQ